MKNSTIKFKTESSVKARLDALIKTFELSHQELYEMVLAFGLERIEYALAQNQSFVITHVINAPKNISFNKKEKNKNH